MRYEKRVLSAIKARKGHIETTGSRSLTARLAIDFGMAGQEALIESTLCTLAEKGQLSIKRMAGDNSPIRSISIIASAKQKPKCRNMATPPESVPAVVDQVEELAMASTRPSEPLHIRLTNTLMALQVNATEGGDVKANSLAELLNKELGLTTDQARLLLRQLEELGLKQSKNLGGGKYSHQVRMDVQEVTSLMVAEMKANKAEIPTSLEVHGEDEDVVSGLLGVIEQLEAAPPEISQDDVTELLSIVEQLEAKLVEASESLSQAMEVIGALRAENASLAEQVAELTAQARVKAAQRAKASEVIARYRSKQS